MHTCGIDPAVVEIEQGADGDGVVDLLVRPSGLIKRLHVFGGDVWRIVIHFVDEAQESLLGVCKRRGLHVVHHFFDEAFVGKQFRRDRGVRLRSKRAVIAARSVGGDEFAEAGGKRGGLTHDLLREAGEVFSGGGFEGEKVPDLGVIAAEPLHGFNRLEIPTGLRIGFYIG